MRYLAALFLPNGHFSKITNSSLAKKNRPDSQFLFTFPLVLSHKVQYIQKLQNSKDKKKTGAGILKYKVCVGFVLWLIKHKLFHCYVLLCGSG